MFVLHMWTALSLIALAFAEPILVRGTPAPHGYTVPAYGPFYGPPAYGSPADEPLPNGQFTAASSLTALPFGTGPSSSMTDKSTWTTTIRSTISLTVTVPSSASASFSSRSGNATWSSADTAPGSSSTEGSRVGASSSTSGYPPSYPAYTTEAIPGTSSTEGSPISASSSSSGNSQAPYWSYALSYGSGSVSISTSVAHSNTDGAPIGATGTSSSFAQTTSTSLRAPQSRTRTITQTLTDFWTSTAPGSTSTEGPPFSLSPYPSDDLPVTYSIRMSVPSSGSFLIFTTPATNRNQGSPVDGTETSSGFLPSFIGQFRAPGSQTRPITQTVTDLETWPSIVSDSTVWSVETTAPASPSTTATTPAGPAPIPSSGTKGPFAYPTKSLSGYEGPPTYPAYSGTSDKRGYPGWLEGWWSGN